MTDIAKCTGVNCPLADTCYRYTAKADPHWQSYFSKPPIKDGKCEHHWPILKPTGAV